MVVLALLACKAVDPAPEDLDGLAYWFWQHYDEDPADTDFDQAVVNLHAALDPGPLAEPSDGSLTRLEQAEVDLVGREDNDASRVSGVYLANVVACPLDEIEWQSWWQDQDDLHPGTYDSYDREFTSDLDAYRAGDSDWLTWRSSYEVSGFGANYSAQIDGWLHRVPDLASHGTLLMARGVLVDEAYFSDSDERGIFQNYQLEIYYPLDDGRVAHLYAMWREMVYLAGKDFSNESVQRVVLNGMADWDEDAVQECASSSGPPER